VAADAPDVTQVGVCLGLGLLGLDGRTRLAGLEASRVQVHAVGMNNRGYVSVTYLHIKTSATTITI
jgi:hypothetical protein